MTAFMTPRQRVRTALNHQEPDRVPTAVGGGPYGIVDEVYFDLLDHFSLGDPVPPFRTGHNISYQDDRLFERLGTDLRYVYPGLSPSSPAQTTADPDRFLDGFGQVWHRAAPYYYAGKGILAEASRIDQIDEIVRWPDVNDPRWTAGVSERARQLREGTDCWIVGRMVTSHGPYQTACDLRGTEEFIIDLVDNEDFAQALLGHVTGTLEGLLHNYMAACGEYIDMVELPGDDYAGNANLLMSPAMFRRFIAPCLRRLVGAIRQVRPDVKIMFHSDGALRKLIPDLIEIGADVIHPLEPLPATDLAAVKAEFGGRVSFLGGIDISHALPGSEEDVVEEVRLRIHQLGAGGGYILAPSNHIQRDVPARNVVRLFEAARQFGQYPLS